MCLWWARPHQSLSHTPRRWRVALSGAILLGMVVTATVGGAHAQVQTDETPSALDEERPLLEELNQQIEARSAELESVKSSLANLEQNLAATKNSVSLVRKKRAELARALDEQKQGVQQRTTQITALENQVQQLENQMQGRLRALYMQGADHPGALLIASTSGANSATSAPLPLAVRASYFKRIKAADEALAQEWRERRVQLQGERDELLKAESALRETDRSLLEENQRLDNLVRSEQALVSKKRGEQTNLERALTSLRAQVLRLETVVSSLTGSSDTEGARVLEEAPKTELAERQIPSPFSGQGLEDLKGKLPRAVQGRVLHPFGKQRVSDLKEYVFRKGLEYLVGLPAQAKAVAHGQVLFAGRMPIYGIVVILDHGERFYSLYGRLSANLVERGQVVSGGDAVGTLGEAPEKTAGNFYFELRRGGTPLNPSQYFSK